MSFLWSQIAGIVIGVLFTLLVVVVPLLADLRPFSQERRWSRKYRAMRADISRLKTKGTR